MASESTQTEIQDSHKPPAIGSPAWISISATQVSRAKKFYEEVFGWKFMSNTGTAAEKLAVFGIPGAPTLLVSFLKHVY
jgi:predicted enzyme related to lactoylglutathione lyase